MMIQSSVVCFAFVGRHGNSNAKTVSSLSPSTTTTKTSSAIFTAVTTATAPGTLMEGTLSLSPPERMKEDFRRAFPEITACSFDDLRKAFPKDADIVKAGGWNNLERLSKDPKGALVKFVADGLNNNNDNNNKGGPDN